MLGWILVAQNWKSCNSHHLLMQNMKADMRNEQKGLVEQPEKDGPRRLRLGLAGRWQWFGISGRNIAFKSEKIQREEEYKVIYLIFLLKMEIWVKKGGGMCPPPQKAYKERKNSHVQNEFLRLRIEWGRLNNSQNASPKHITQKGVQLLSCPTLAPRLAKFS